MVDENIVVEEPVASCRRKRSSSRDAVGLSLWISHWGVCWEVEDKVEVEDMMEVEKAMKNR